MIADTHLRKELSQSNRKHGMMKADKSKKDLERNKTQLANCQKAFSLVISSVNKPHPPLKGEQLKG